MFSLVVSVNDELVFNSVLLPSLEPLYKYLCERNLPPLQLVKVSGKSSICKNYNEGMNKCVFKTKFFVHEDVDLLDTKEPPVFISIDNLIRSFPNTGLVGLVGTKENPKGFWWNCTRDSIVGHVICKEYLRWHIEEPFYSVNIVDGMFLATSTDIKFSEDIEGFHFYDSDYSNKIKQAGYDVKAFMHIVNHKSTTKDLSKVSSEYYDRKWELI